MTKWKEKAKEHFRRGGLLEPLTKSAKLRAALPMIEEALANGYTYQQCLEQLKGAGVEMSEAYFRVALHRARKQGPLQLSETSAASEREQKKSNREKRESKSEPKEMRKVAASGATIVLKQRGGMFISSVEEKDQLTNAMPKMEDFL